MSWQAISTAVSSAYTTAQPYFQVFSAISSVMSGVQSYQQGLNQAAEARIKAKQVQLDADLKALNKQQEGVRLARNQQRIAASLLARAAAGNVDPFSGSAKTIADVNEAYLGKDLLRLQKLQEQYKSYGDVMNQILNQQADAYEKNGQIGFLTSMGEGIYTLGETFTPTPLRDPEFVSGYETYSSQAQDFGSQYSGLLGGESALPNYSIGPKY